MESMKDNGNHVTEFDSCKAEETNLLSFECCAIHIIHLTVNFDIQLHN